MDPRTAAAMNDSGVYNFAEIWQVFQMGGASPSPHGFGAEPMATDDRLNQDQNQNQNPYSNQKSRKRREEDERGKAGGSTSNRTPICNNNVMSEGDMKRMKPLHENSTDEEGNNLSEAPPKQDYIHVRARRGQATDSHSLAERARREKISERMRILQDLVPGCNKVIGKALVLDEIINYIQSLQRQVEFLSMKLEAVSARATSLDGFPPKDVFSQQGFDAFGSQTSRDYDRGGSSAEWLHMQIGGGCD